MDIVSTDQQVEFRLIEKDQRLYEQSITYQESFFLTPEHTTYPAIFAVTLVATWTFPEMLKVTVVAVVQYGYRNDNLPPKIDNLKMLADKAIKMMDTEINVKRKDFGVNQDLYIQPLIAERVLPAIKGALRNAYPLN
jgi:hypothetical protein